MTGASIATLPVAATPIAEAFAQYCKRPSSEVVVELIGERAVAAILQAPAHAGQFPVHPLRMIVCVVAGAVALAATILPIEHAVAAALLAVAACVLLLVGEPWIRYIRDRVMNRHEPTRTELASFAGNPVQARNLQSLEEFRRKIGSGAVKAYTVSPSGSVKLLTGKSLACFAADHGRILLISENLNDWFGVPARPVPQGAIWIDLCGAVEREKLGKLLIEEPDEDRHRMQMAWVRDQAAKRGITGGALISGLAIIEAYRDPSVRSLPTAKAVAALRAVLKGPAASDSVILKMHSGNYPEFETAMKSLPLEDLP